MTVKPSYPALNLAVRAEMGLKAHLGSTARCEAVIGEHGIF
jgi:hypothetical protein